MVTTIPIGIALRQGLKGYNIHILKRDIFAALVVSLLALPLSMALSIAVGLPPQHGIYTAIVAGFIVPLLGGSLTQVTGPTAAFVVILAPIVTELGLRGIVWSGILAGFILIGLGISKLGKLINYVPYPVTTGFTAGIAVVLATLSLNDFLGLGVEHLDGHFVDKVWTLISHMPQIHYFDTSIGLITLVFLFLPIPRMKWLPNAVTAMLIGSLLGLMYQHFGHTVQTIGNHFSYFSETGKIVAGIPPYPPTLSLPTLAPGYLFTLPTLAELKILLFPAFTIAILAALESLLSATVADSISGQKHDPDAELNGIGIGNILSALASGIPATGAIARTATNIHSGGKTPLSASMHALFVMLYVLFFSRFMSHIPMACLAALLISTAYRMSHYKQFYRVLTIAPKSDVCVLLTCFLLTVFVDMIAGVGIGMICAAFLLIKRITEMTQVEFEAQETGVTTTQLPKGTLVHRIRGPLFFGTIEKAFDRQKVSYERIDKLIVDTTNVPFIDMTGLVAMNSMLASIAHASCFVHIVCNTPTVESSLKKKILGATFAPFVYFHSTLEDALGFSKATDNVV